MKNRISLGAGAHLGTAAAILAFPILATAGEPSDLDGMKTANGKVVAAHLLGWNQGKMSDEKNFAADFVNHGYLGGPPRDANAPAAPPLPPPLPPGTPPVHIDFKKFIAQGDLVFVQAHVTGGLGEKPGEPPPPNGELQWLLFRVKNGKITEHWSTHNPIPDDQVGKQW